MKYQEVRVLGQGGFGLVHEVANESGERFARKTFHPGAHIPSASHEKLRKRFKREVGIQREIGGRTILPVLEADLAGSPPWFVMPLADAIYEDQIAIDRRDKVVDINAIADILNGLQNLHELGYVHRDLNPKNILHDNGVWKLSDLGAVLPPQGQTVTLTEGTVIYTERYCSPEQRQDFHNAQSPADIYAFGCILHDLFGTVPRTPYSQHSAPGPVGPIIEKCTELNPKRRPRIIVLREMLLETLVDIGGHFEVSDAQAKEWLLRLETMEDWDDADFEAFGRFFYDLDIHERTEGFEADYVNSLSTPFLARMPVEPLEAIVKRQDGLSAAIVEKYCEWVRTTSFRFGFSDTVCNRLTSIFDCGSISDKAMAIVALLRLGSSHNRWYVMSSALSRLHKTKLSEEEARRLAIEIRTEEVESNLKRCVSEIDFVPTELASQLAKLL